MTAGPGPGRFGQSEVPERPPPAGLFTRGYDRAGTEQLVDRLTARLHERTTRLYTVERENRRLRAERTALDHAARVAEVQDSIAVLTSAQEHADQTVAEADAYRKRVGDEAERVRDEARREAEEILADARARSRQVVDRLDAQAADRERQARQQQDVLERQTSYLRSVRDTAGTQMLSFLNGLVDHVAAEFGAADPAAVPAGAPGGSGADRPAEPPDARRRPPPALVPVAQPPSGRSGAGPGGRRARREPRTQVRHLAGR